MMGCSNYRASRLCNIALLFVLAAHFRISAEEAGSSIRLTLPPSCYAVVGRPISVYFDNIVLTKTPDQLDFRVPADLGQRETNRWTLTPEGKHVGTHELSFGVTDKTGKSLGEAVTKLTVVPADAGDGKKVSLLIVGDSLTHASLYPNEVARLLAEPGNPQWKMLGTHVPKQAKANVAHEGYGGWTWGRFATHFELKPDPAARRHSSPFVFAGNDGKPMLDSARYFDSNFGGERPNIITVLLGINDCFSANPDDPKAIEARIDQMFEHADRMLAEFRRAAPDADIGVCLTTPPNARDSGFDVNYKGKYTRWGWKRIQHRLVERELVHFKNRDVDRIYIVPTELDIDPVAGYPVDNAVHPNASGYQQIGGTLYAFIKWRLNSSNSSRSTN